MPDEDIEYRTFSEFRIDGEPGKRKIVGYAAVFNKLSQNLGMFREKIRPGAFAKTIQESDIRALVDHMPEKIIGRTKNKTLTLAEDEHGLRVEINPPATSYANDLVASIDRGDIDQMSFGFRTIKDEWDETDPKDLVRTLVEVKLFDVSPVTFPAYTQTSVSVRSKVEAMRNPRPEPGANTHSDPEPDANVHSYTREKQRLAELDAALT